jgi:hypothetical protein
MRNNFTLYEHPYVDPDPARFYSIRCLGPSPEIMLTCLLRRHGLDVRPDADEVDLSEVDPTWKQKQNARDEADAARYGGGR